MSVAVGLGEGRAGVPQALRSEWLKLRTVRSSVWSVLLLLGVSVLFSTLIAWDSETVGGSPGNPGDNDLVLDSLAGLFFGQIAAAVLAVLAITSEYSTGMIRTTLAANPRRVTLLAAKAVVVAAVVFAAGLVTSVACFQLGQVFLRSSGFTYENGYPAESLADGDTLRAVAGSAVYLGLLALFALSVGAILRHTAGAITAVLAFVLAPMIAISFLPEDLAERFGRFSIMGAGVAMQQTVEREGKIPLEPWQGLGVVSAYAVVALVAALWLFRRRDT